MSKSDTIDEIAEGATSDSADGYRLPERRACLPHVVQEKPRQDRDRRYGQDRHEPRQQAKRRAAILGVFQCQPAVDYLDSGFESARTDGRDERVTSSVGRLRQRTLRPQPA